MELEFKKYILKKYGSSIPSLYRNTILIGQALEIDMVKFMNTLDELDVLLRLKNPIKIDTDDINWLNDQQKEKLNKLMSDQKKIFAKRI